MKTNRTIPLRRRIPNPRRALTVCISTIGDGGHIFGAADRMITSLDIEFEPNLSTGDMNPKIRPVTSAIVVMMAGDMGLQLEIMGEHVQPEVNRRVAKAPTEWLKVQDVVDIYVAGYNKVRSKRAEVQILAPLNMTFKSFADQSKFSTPFLEGVTKRLLDFALPVQVEAIVVGVEPTEVEGHTRSRIFAILDNVPTCCDAVKFAAIGSGARHAEAHLMLVGHSATTPTPEQLLNIYAAKRRAEIAPGVGKCTDVFTMSSALGSYSLLRPELLAKMEEIFNTMNTEQTSSTKNASVSATAFVTDFIASLAGVKQESPPAAGSESKPDKLSDSSSTRA